MIHRKVIHRLGRAPPLGVARLISLVVTPPNRVESVLVKPRLVTLIGVDIAVLIAVLATCLTANNLVVLTEDRVASRSKHRSVEQFNSVKCVHRNILTHTTDNEQDVWEKFLGILNIVT